MPGTISQAEMLADAMESRLSDLHVAGPGRVVKYDASRETVDVQPQFRRTIETDEGVFLHETLPIIPDVPISWPSGNGGACFMAWPLAVGDPVLLVFLERDPGAWRETGSVGPTGDNRLHPLGAAVAFPGGIRANGERLGTGKVHDGKVVIGDGVLLGSAAAAQAMMLGTSFMSALNSMLNSIQSAAAGATAPDTAEGALLSIASAIGSFLSGGSHLSAKHAVDE